MRFELLCIALAFSFLFPCFSSSYAHEHYVFSGQISRKAQAESYFRIWDGVVSQNEYVILPIRNSPQITTQPFLSGTSIVVKGHGIGGSKHIPHIGLMLYQLDSTDNNQLEKFIENIQTHLRSKKLQVYLVNGASDDAGHFLKELSFITGRFEAHNIAIAQIWHNVLEKKTPIEILYDDAFQEDTLDDEALSFKTYVGGKGGGGFGIIVDESILDSRYWPYTLQISHKKFKQTTKL